MTFVASEKKIRLKIFHSDMTQRVKRDGTLYRNVIKEISLEIRMLVVDKMGYH